MITTPALPSRRLVGSVSMAMRSARGSSERWQETTENSLGQSLWQSHGGIAGDPISSPLSWRPSQELFQVWGSLYLKKGTRTRHHWEIKDLGSDSDDTVAMPIWYLHFQS